MNYVKVCLVMIYFEIVESVTLLPTKYWAAASYPNPQVNPFACGLDQPGYVCDPNQVLTRTERERVNLASIRLQRETNSRCFPSNPTDNRTDHAAVRSHKGYTLYVALMHAITRQNRKAENYMIWNLEQFTRKLLEKYNAGNLCKDYILIVFSSADKMIWTETGRDVKSELSTSELNDTFMSCLHLFKEGDYASGLVQTIHTYNFWINDLSQPIGEEYWWIVGAVGGIAFLMIVDVFCL